MRKASISDRDLFVDIIAESFADNPSVCSVVRKKNKKNSISALACYVFDYSIRRNAVWISSDCSGAVACYQKNTKKDDLLDYWLQFVLLVRSLNLWRLADLLKKESFLVKKREDEPDYLYLWMYGVKAEGRGKTAAKELMSAVFDESRKKKLPICLETSVPGNKRKYEKYGFSSHAEWENRKEGYTLWLLKRAVPKD